VDCGERAATVFLSKVVDGAVVQRNLCAHCARSVFGHPPASPPPVAFLSPPSVNPDFLARPKDCPAEIEIAEPVTVQELAAKLCVKPFHVIAVLVTHSVFITGKEPINKDTTAVVCRHYGVALHEVTTGTERA
jgi:hypothetical protein